MTRNDFETLKLQREKAEINGKIDALTIRRDAIEHKLAEIKGHSVRQFIAEEIVHFLLDTGYVEAAEAVAKEYEI